MHEVERKLWLMLINRGSEIDNPSKDVLYLNVERAIILWGIPVVFHTDETRDELNQLLKILNLA